MCLVIKEIENGLHPAQADKMAAFPQTAISDGSKQVIVTAHSPALLNAVEGQYNDKVVVCHRNPETGYSDACRLTELDGYTAAMTRGHLGNLTSQGMLTAPSPAPHNDTDVLQRLGIL